MFVGEIAEGCFPRTKGTAVSSISIMTAIIYIIAAILQGERGATGIPVSVIWKKFVFCSSIIFGYRDHEDQLATYV
jgi:hypothetical protein